MRDNFIKFNLIRLTLNLQNMKTTRSLQKIRIHDGIVGAVYLLSVILAFTVNIQWLYLAGAVAVLQISSYFTGFCPVYFVLDRMMPSTDQNIAGRKSTV
jgi:hypothetical protein